MSVEANNTQDIITNLKYELQTSEDHIRLMGDRIRRALEVADEEKVYRCGDKPKHIRMAEILRGK